MGYFGRWSFAIVLKLFIAFTLFSFKASGDRVILYDMIMFIFLQKLADVHLLGTHHGN